MKILYAGLLATGLLTLAGGAWAQAAHPVKVTNTGKLPVISLSIAKPGSNDWQADMLGVRTIKSGQTLTVQVKSDACTVDFQAVMDDGKLVEKAGVDICAEGAAVSF